MSRSVLFIQTAFLGDVVLATAALEAWHAAHPEDKVDVLVRKPMDGLFEGIHGCGASLRGTSDHGSKAKIGGGSCVRFAAGDTTWWSTSTDMLLPASSRR